MVLTQENVYGSHRGNDKGRFGGLRANVEREEECYRFPSVNRLFPTPPSKENLINILEMYVRLTDILGYGP